jgi:hypothetical protein
MGLQLFAKYDKHYQNVNSKRLQLTAVYVSTVNGYLALFFNFDIMASDIRSDNFPTRHPPLCTTCKNCQLSTKSKFLYPTSTRRHGNFAGVHTLLRIILSSKYESYIKDLKPDLT